MMAELTNLQRSLYGNNVNAGKTNPNLWNSSQILKSDTRSVGEKLPETPRTPWGRHMSYGGFGIGTSGSKGNYSNDIEFTELKGHQHYGSGLFPHPRGVPVKQFYDVTNIKRSNVRSNDELVPRPQTCEISKIKIPCAIPKKSPFSSHISRQALFPVPERKGSVHEAGDGAAKEDCQCISTDTCTCIKEKFCFAEMGITSRPQTTVLCKAMGNFGRREMVVPQIGQSMYGSLNQDKKDQAIKYSRWFSRHDVIANFTKAHPSETVALDVRKGRRQAFWHAAVGYCAR